MTLETSIAGNASAPAPGYPSEDQTASTRGAGCSEPVAGVREIPTLTHLDLFSGIGGFALAARWAGIKTIGFSEIEPYACRVLAKNFPDVQNYGDIKKLSGLRADIVTGGFPCQPFSLAGKQRGKEDDRHLWPEMLRVIADARPSWVVGENVPGIIGMELDGVLSDLESHGYTSWPLGIPACAVDARHRRQRVWIVAHAHRGDSGTGRNGCQNQKGTRADHQPARSNQDAEYVANAAGEQARRLQQRAFSAYPGDGGDGRSQTSSWHPEPELGRVAHGIPNRAHRLRGLGNAIVPQVAFVILDAIAAIEFAEWAAGAPVIRRLGGFAEAQLTKKDNT